MTSESLEALVAEQRVLVLAGSGGVGKTTLAAALALEGARRGRRTVCITIDPARRLATSLALPDFTGESRTLTAEWLAEQGVQAQSSLDLVMLDTKRTFDELVKRRATTAAARDRILANRLYQHISANLAGTQAYMAMEKVLELRQRPDFDLIVLDTPPMAHALDFLEAPERLVDAIDSPLLRALAQAQVKPTRLSLNLMARGVSALVSGVGRITGVGFVQHTAELLQSLNDLFGGFRSRAEEVSQAFRGQDTSYIVVSSAAEGPLSEAHYFSWRLREQGMHADALVVNRIEPRLDGSPSQAELAELLLRRGLSASVPLEKVKLAADEQRRLIEVQERELAELDVMFPRSVIPRRLFVPSLGGEVHGVAQLARLKRWLCPV